MINRRLWLIDAGYMFNARHNVAPGYEFSYLKLRNLVETDGDIWRAYYFNSTPNPSQDTKDPFHNWLRSANPQGPKIITKLYDMKKIRANRAYCEVCEEKVSLICQSYVANGPQHRLINEVQKGVDVGIATLALIHKDMYDTLILSSGDSDLLDAVEYLTEYGKNIELVVFKTGVSTELQSRANNIYWLDDFSDDISNTYT